MVYRLPGLSRFTETPDDLAEFVVEATIQPMSFNLRENILPGVSRPPPARYQHSSGHHLAQAAAAEAVAARQTDGEDV